MSKINVLGFEIANLISAGEVVDRPASVVKELVENSIDSGATSVTAEIRDGGISLIRISDNGCGMSPEDLPLSIRRHATSKISTADDLTAIATLGFRGEALAAISSVCDITIITKTREADQGSMLTAVSGEVTDLCEVGCGDGTTVVCEQLFGRVPARRKFLKKDRTEAMAVTALMEKVALSRPDIAFRYVCDGTVKFTTAGDGNPRSVLYALYGKEFASELLELHGERGGVKVTGFVGTSENTRNNRNFQNVFINGRYVRSRTVGAAVEQAFVSYIAPDRFPVCDIYLELHPSTVDVNVHPAKMEVRFSDERPVFEAVYWSVRTALEGNTARPEMKLRDREKELRTVAAFTPIGRERPAEQISFGKLPASQHTDTSRRSEPAVQRTGSVLTGTAATSSSPISSVASHTGDFHSTASAPRPAAHTAADRGTAMQPAFTPCEPAVQQAETERQPCAESAETAPPSPVWRYIGEIFDCYVIIEYEGALMLIDKHAAHERILFEKLRATVDSEGKLSAETLLIPITPALDTELFAAACDGRDELRMIGYEFDINDGIISLLTIPGGLSRGAAEDFFTELCVSMARGEGGAELSDASRREQKLYQMACKAAIKGGRSYDRAHIDWLCDTLLSLPDITVCPHGRPVAYRITKTELDRQFGRI